MAIKQDSKSILTILTYLMYLFVFLSASMSSASETSKGKAPNPHYQIITNMGSMTIELFADKAPITVNNFEQYVKEKYYDGLIFHRVIPGFMVQAGGFDRFMQQKPTMKPIKNEAQSRVKNKRYTLSMARQSSPHSATSQFFINLADNPHLDKTSINAGYAVFGKIVSGENVLNTIASSQTHKVSIYQHVPVKPVIIEQIIQQTH